MLVVFGATLLMAVLALAFAYWALSPENDNRLPPAELQRLEKLKNVALGLLENENYSEADGRLTEITLKAPREPLAWRNLAICRLLWSEFGGTSRPEPAVVQEAIEELARREPNEPLPHLLLARWELRAEQDAPDDGEIRLARAAASLRKAADLSPRDPAPRFELYERTKSAQRADLAALGLAALEEAYPLALDNLWMLKERLVTQAQTKEPKLRETISEAKERLGPVRALIARRSPYDVFEFLEACAAAVEKDDWGAALGQARIVDNLVKSDDVLQADYRRLLPHLLEFADYDFSPEFRRQLAGVEPPELAGIPVSFQRERANDAFQKLSGVLALAVADFDLNGTPDLIVFRGGEVVVLGRVEKTDPWRILASAEIPEGYVGLLAADLDEDENREAVERRRPGELPPPAGSELNAENVSTADVDLVLFGPAGVLLLRNVRDPETGARTLEPVELEAELASVRGVSAAVLLDFYHDGDLDLVLATSEGIKFWTNQGNMKFGDLTNFSITPPAELTFSALVAVDWDRDADLDVIAVGPDSKALGVLENERHGQFRWRPLDEAFSNLGPATGVALLEADGNASWDLATAGGTGVQTALTATVAGVVRPIRTAGYSIDSITGVQACDYDNDGRQDLLAYGESGVHVLRGGESGKFAPATNLFDTPPAAVRCLAVADFDLDGDLDLVVAEQDSLVLYANEGGNKNHWLRLHLRGGQDPQKKSNGRVNHNAVGSLVEVKSGPSYQAQVATGQAVHFGLGAREQAEVARIVWTNGLPQAVVEPHRDQVIHEVLVLKGSCPYLYTWTGERFEFFTDLLWAAPLGLQFGEGRLAPWREWEYLKIPGERLAAQDGRYRLQITEELWEAAYFDQVELLAVDHPEDVEVYSNEKVGPAEIAEFKVHTVRSPQTPRAARDKHGQDVLEQVRRRDGVYFRGFDGRKMQGLVDEHYLELDLGELESPRQITLFLTGWIRPTDTSLNVGIGENPAIAPPRPPFLLVPNARGEWIEAKSYLGFPGGKTKTIAVDLSGVFPTADYRLRIVTSAEIYWDEAFFTVDEEPAPVRVTSLKLLAADLHPRGCSEALPLQPNSPETYDYARVSTVPRWPPMKGLFTRYGDVRELLLATDDRHAVLGWGDELTLEFSAAESSAEKPLGLIAGPPPGWKRDFLLHNVGWDKDADLNTVHGQTVEPLPFSAMKRYPYGVDESYPDMPEHRRYLQTYQTRRQSQAGFWRWLQE